MRRRSWRNPRGDEELRRLERLAAAGDEQARGRLLVEYLRMGVMPAPDKTEDRRERDGSWLTHVDTYAFPHGYTAWVHWMVVDPTRHQFYAVAVHVGRNGWAGYDGAGPKGERFGVNAITFCPPSVAHQVDPGHYSVRLTAEDVDNGLLLETLQRIAALPASGPPTDADWDRLEAEQRVRRASRRRHRNPPRGDEHLRDLERMAKTGDLEAQAAFHAERYRRGLPFVPDEVRTDVHGNPWLEYHFTPTSGVALAREWGYGYDSGVQFFMPLTFLHDHAGFTGWHEHPYGQSVLSPERGESRQDALQRQLRVYYENATRHGGPQVWA